jgi:predicted Zn-dependent peptidase
MIDAGSRDENPQNNGVAHFIEHTVFKGTLKRRSHHILRRIENVGGELNAFTTREKTCYYASCLKRYTGRAVDLLTDITFNSQFPETELQKEKKVILEEIDMYDDSPEESIYDDFYCHLFGQHPLGYNILGTKESVTNLNRTNILDFIEKNYSQGNIVFSIVGGITPSQAEKLAVKYLENLNPGPKQVNIREAPEIKQPFKADVKKDFAQSHCILGSRAFSRQDERRYALILLSNILGGSGMSSRLNMAVREKHGLVYTIGTHYSVYQDAGVFSIYFGADKNNVDRCLSIIRKELKLICNNPLSERQLNIARQQLLGQTAMMIENPSFLMQHQARSLLDYEYVQGFREYEEKIKNVNPEQLMQVAAAVLNPDNLSQLTYSEEDTKE